MRTCLHPGLSDPASEPPVLLGTRCGACATVYFPPLGIGCEVCGAGADQLVVTSIAAAGTLHSVATVHLHRSSDIAAPFAVGEIQLDAGPLVRATLLELLDVDAIGTRVTAQWTVVGTADDGSDLVEPRFGAPR